MTDKILHNWQKKSAEHQKQYKRFLKRADKNAVLKRLPELHEEAFCQHTFFPGFTFFSITQKIQYAFMEDQR